MVEDGLVTEGTSSTAFILDGAGRDPHPAARPSHPAGGHAPRRAQACRARRGQPRGAAVQRRRGVCRARGVHDRGLGLRAAGGGDRRRRDRRRAPRPGRPQVPRALYRGSAEDSSVLAKMPRSRCNRGARFAVSRVTDLWRKPHSLELARQAAGAGRGEAGRGAAERRRRRLQPDACRRRRKCARSRVRQPRRHRRDSYSSKAKDCTRPPSGARAARSAARSTPSSSAAATAASAPWRACLPERACRSACCRSARSIISPRISAFRLAVEEAAATIAAGQHARRRSRRGQRRDLHQQFLDRHLSLHGHRPRAAEGPAQARQMDGHGAGLLPHAAPFPAAALAHLGRGLRAALPHALPVRRQQRIRHGAVHLRHGAERLDTGKLWFYVVKPRKPLEFFWMVCRLCFGHLDQARDLDTLRARPRRRSAPRRAGCRWRSTAR